MERNLVQTRLNIAQTSLWWSNVD